MKTLEENILDDLKEERLNKYLSENPQDGFSKQFVGARGRPKKTWNLTIENDARRILRRRLKTKKESAYRAKIHEKQRIREEVRLKRQAEREALVLTKEDKLKRKLQRLADLRNSGLTLEQIGKRRGRSRERIRQMLVRARELGIEAKVRIPRPKRVCPCGKDSGRLKYCSKECRNKNRKYQTKEERAKAAQDRVKYRYHNDPDFKKKRIEATLRYYHKTKHTPEHKARRKIHTERWFKRNPEKRAEYQRRNWQRIKADPAEYAEYLERQRDSYRRRKLKSKLIKK